MDTNKRTWKNDTIGTRKAKIVKKMTAEAQMKTLQRVGSSNTDDDQDINISFMKDTNEEINTDEIEEEDWIE